MGWNDFEMGGGEGWYPFTGYVFTGAGFLENSSMLNNTQIVQSSFEFPLSFWESPNWPSWVFKENKTSVKQIKSTWYKTSGDKNQKSIFCCILTPLLECRSFQCSRGSPLQHFLSSLYVWLHFFRDGYPWNRKKKLSIFMVAYAKRKYNPSKTGILYIRITPGKLSWFDMP